MMYDIKPGSEADSATCEDPTCHWSASGPMSSPAGVAHNIETGHHWRLTQPVVYGYLPDWCTCPDDCDCDGQLVCGVQAGTTTHRCQLQPRHDGWHIAGAHRWENRT